MVCWSYSLYELARRAKGPHLFRYAFDDLGESLPFRGRAPGEVRPVALQADVGEETLEHGELPPGVEIPRDVVAFPGMAAGHEHPVSAALQRLHDVKRIDPARAGDPDYPHVRRILYPAYPGQIRSGIRAPVADDGVYLRLPAFSWNSVIHIFSINLWRNT